MSDAKKTEESVEKKRVPIARYGVVESTYHQLIGEQPTSNEVRYNVDLFTEVEPYRRTYKIGEPGKLHALDFGWVDDPGMVCVENVGDVEVTIWKGNGPDGLPTIIIPPRQSFRGIFAGTDVFIIADKPSKVKITVYPHG